MVIVEMTAMSLISGFSNRNANAKTSTNAKVEDLHNANVNLIRKSRENCRMQELYI